MNHELLKSIIYDQHELIQNATIVARPSYTFEPNANYVLVGLRRAGKSTLLYKIVRELVASGVSWDQIIYINFEDERLSEFQKEDFNDVLSVQSELSSGQGYFFFDEIQIVSGWEKFCRRMADAKERVYVTGSNAGMLSREISTTLGGRYLTKYVTPYDFEEYLTALDVPHDHRALLQTKANGRIRSHCGSYLQYGGFPEALQYTAKREYISSVYQKILLGDIIARNGIRNDYAIKILMKKLAESVKSEISYTKLHGILKSIGIAVGKDSIIDYIQYAKDAYLIFSIQNFYARFAERESNPKYYFSDNGLLNLFLDDKKPSLLENAVAVCLTKKHPEDVYYLKSPKTGIDIDFYVPSARQAIQVAYSIQGDAYEREVGNLKKFAATVTEPHRYIIVTYEEETTLELSDVKIEVVSLMKFLLTK